MSDHAPTRAAIEARARELNKAAGGDPDCWHSNWGHYQRGWVAYQFAAMSQLEEESQRAVGDDPK